MSETPSPNLAYNTRYLADMLKAAYHFLGWYGTALSVKFRTATFSPNCKRQLTKIVSPAAANRRQP